MLLLSQKHGCLVNYNKIAAFTEKRVIVSVASVEFMRGSGPISLNGPKPDCVTDCCITDCVDLIAIIVGDSAIGNDGQSTVSKYVSQCI